MTNIIIDDSFAYYRGGGLAIIDCETIYFRDSFVNNSRVYFEEYSDVD